MELEDLKTAIAMRAPVSFEYEKTPGNRTGNPHAVFVFRRQDSTESTKVHIEQTGGVSDSGQSFPSFRLFDLNKIHVIEIHIQDAPFEVSSDYNAEWDGYQFVIAKV